MGVTLSRRKTADHFVEGLHLEEGGRVRVICDDRTCATQGRSTIELTAVSLKGVPSQGLRESALN